MCPCPFEPAYCGVFVYAHCPRCAPYAALFCRIEDKIKDSLRKCNAFIQILTEDVERESREKGWLGNEPAWAGSSGITNFALFVEKGARASGVIVTKTEPLFFDRNALAEIAPKVIDYLRDLKQRTSESQHQKQEEKSRKREKVFTPGYR